MQGLGIGTLLIDYIGVTFSGTTSTLAFPCSLAASCTCKVWGGGLRAHGSPLNPKLP